MIDAWRAATGSGATLNPSMLETRMKPRAETHDPFLKPKLRWRRPARALRAAGEAVAGRADARGAGRRARRHRRCAVRSRRCGCSSSRHWMYVRGAQDFSQMTSVSKDLHAVLDAHYTLARPEGRRRAGFRRRHAQVAASPARRTRGRTAARGRVRLYPRSRSRHALRSPARSAAR